MDERPAPTWFSSLEAAVDFLLARIEGPLHVGAPLGIGKPNRLLNTLYARVEQDPARRLHLYTALSLDPPDAGKGLEARFLGTFVRRHFGDDYPRLAYVQALKRNALPAHVEVEEFYLQSGALLHSPSAQQRYVSLNYTHVARALADRGVNAIVQKVAREPNVAHGVAARLSLSSNTDLTFDAVDAIVARGLPRPLLIAEVDPELPWLGGQAAVDARYFDAVVMPPAPYPKLFALPRQPVTDADYAIGFLPARSCATAAPCRSVSARWRTHCATRLRFATPTMPLTAAYCPCWIPAWRRIRRYARAAASIRSARACTAAAR